MVETYAKLGVVGHRALAVVRGVESVGGFYEAWLHHEREIRVRDFGISRTKDSLQLAADLSGRFPTCTVSSDDIAEALGTSGDEVFVFYLLKGASTPKRPVPIDKPGPDTKPYRRPPFGPILPLGPKPLGPIALETPKLYSADQVQLLQDLDCTYRDTIESIMSGGQPIASVTKTGKIYYEDLAKDYLDICSRVPTVFGKGPGSNESGSAPLDLGGSA